MLIKKILLVGFTLFSSLTMADDLIFEVTNLSKSIVYFTSSDYFDMGTAVNFNRTESHTYHHPPKNMSITISNGAYDSNFYIITDESCDALGFQPYREWHKGPIGSSFKRYTSGYVHITISDMEGSTVTEKKITCSTNP
jgi:hypothetical protein